MKMTVEELKLTLDIHQKWINEEIGGARANLSGANLSWADLSGANLSGANLSGAKINWNSHQLISEILLRAAGDCPKKRMIAGLVRISTDWCWDKITKIKHPEKKWAVNELKKWVKGRDSAPEILIKD